MPAGPLNYVLSLEGDDWFGPRRIAELADTYTSNHSGSEKVKFVGSTHIVNNGRTGARLTNDGRFGHGIAPPRGHSPTRCYNCHSTGHVAKFCPRTGKTGKTENQGQSNFTGEVKRCFVCHSTGHLARFCPQNSSAKYSKSQVQSDNVQVNACYAHDGGSGVLIGSHAVRCDEVAETLTDKKTIVDNGLSASCLLYTSPSPRD